MGAAPGNSANDRNTRAEGPVNSKLAQWVPFGRLPSSAQQTNGRDHRSPFPALILLADFSDEGAAQGGPATGGLSGATVARLRTVLTNHIAHPDVADPELARVLRQIVVEARNRKIRAEQLIVMLKNVWDALPDARHAIDREAQLQVRQRLITLCIKAYYEG